MRIAVAQFSAVADKVTNVEKAARLVRRAAAEGADLVVLPEFFNTIYFPQYSDVRTHWSLAEPDDGVTIQTIARTAQEAGVTIVAPIYEEAQPGLHYDTAFVIGTTGEIVAKYRKTHAPLVEGGYEKMYYTPGSQFPVFVVNGWRCGVTICYDWRFPEAARSLGVQGAELIVMPFAARPVPMWEEVLRTRAWENQAYVAVCNKVGQDDNWLFAGRSMIIDPFGEVLARCGSEDDALILANLDRGDLRRAGVADFNWRDRRPEIYQRLTVPADQTW